MKKNWLSVFVALLLLAFLAAPVSAWQGRMAGAGDAYGLIEDESDYLTHPAVIAMSKGFNAYGHYRLTYTKTSDWDYTVSLPSGPYLYPFKAGGDEWKNEGLLGAAFKLGAGMMGMFFEYTSIRGDYDGSALYDGVFASGFNTYDMQHKLDDYALRLIYGLPVGAVNLGAEVQIAYRNEEKETLLVEDDGDFYLNFPFGAEGIIESTLFPYMIPYKSKYWEAQGKVSVAGTMGAAKYALTFKGGFPFASDNKYTAGYYDGSTLDCQDAEGKVKGYNVGGDFWLRVPVNAKVALPFVVSAGYKKVTRDGDFASPSGLLISYISYEHEAEYMNVGVGGGVDFTPAKGTKVAAGLYYDYIRTSQKATFDYIDSGSNTFYDDYPDMPTQTEHRLTLKALAEKELTSTLAVRGGFNVFYGYVEADYATRHIYNGVFEPDYKFDISADGYNAGANASVGATFKLDKVALEPFLNAGYVKYSVDGDGLHGFAGPINGENDKADWHVGGGLSVRF